MAGHEEGLADLDKKSSLKAEQDAQGGRREDGHGRWRDHRDEAWEAWKRQLCSRNTGSIVWQESLVSRVTRRSVPKGTPASTQGVAPIMLKL